MNSITADSTQYYAVIAALNADTLMHVSDIVLNPPTANMYQVIKKRLITEFSDSEQKRLKTLISELTLGDDKPSLLLRKMRQLAGSCLSDELLQTLWLQRLPNQAQAILSVSDDKLDKLALMADKILETTEQAGSNCYAVAQTPPADQIVVLQQQVAELAKQMQSLTRAQTPNLVRGTRFRSKSRNRNTLGITMVSAGIILILANRQLNAKSPVILRVRETN